MTHEEIKILISAYIDGEVTLEEKTIIEEHLTSCASCQKEYKNYKSISSSLAQWPNENLSPDEEIKVQRRIEQRREPMFTTPKLFALGTALALTVMIGSTVQTFLHKGVQGRLKSASDDIGDQYSDKKSQYEPYYMASNYAANANTSGLVRRGTMVTAYDNGVNKRLGEGLVSYDAGVMQPIFGGSSLGHAMMKAAVAGNEAVPDKKVIKNADITVKVQDAQKAQSSLEALVTKYDGTIVNLTINKSSDGSRNGLVTFRVLSKDFESVLREIRKLGEVESENQIGSDITNQYQYIQNRISDYKAADNNLHKVLNKTVNDVDNSLNVQGEIANVEANINAMETSLKQLDDQAYMATVSVNFYDTVEITHKTPSFKDNIITTIKENAKSTVQTCCTIAINSFSGVVIVLSFLFQVMLWSLLFWGIYLLIRKISGK